MAEFKWTLKWSGTRPCESMTEAVKYLDTFRMWKPAHCHLITYEEYEALIQSGEIAPAESWWKIGKDEVGLIALSCYNQYSTTWQQINTGYTDFLAGFAAGEKKYLLLEAHEEAIKINKAIDKYRIESDKPCSKYISPYKYEHQYCTDCDYDLGQCPRGNKSDIMKKIMQKLEEYGVDHRGKNLSKRRH